VPRIDRPTFPRSAARRTGLNQETNAMTLPNQRYVLSAILATTTAVSAAYYVEEYKSGIEWNEPSVVDPGGPHSPPSDAIVLLGDGDLSAWNGGDKWSVEDGVAHPTGKGGITSQQSFGDLQMHIEWASPEQVEGRGQGRGNSGIYLMGKYEVQILDSWENETYFDGQAGSIYKQWPPLVNVCRKPGEWQTYDILFTAPRFDDAGKVATPGFVTVLHNGVVVQNHAELQGGTFYDRPPAYEAHDDRLPIQIQDHGNPVRFRNIWVRDLAAAPPQKKE
jgi:hypothetical protein